MEPGDIVKLKMDWTPAERGVRYLLVGVQTALTSEYPEQAELLRVEHMHSGTYPRGACGARRNVPLDWLKVDAAATAEWREVRETPEQADAGGED